MKELPMRPSALNLAISAASLPTQLQKLALCSLVALAFLGGCGSDNNSGGSGSGVGGHSSNTGGRASSVAGQGPTLIGGTSAALSSSSGGSSVGGSSEAHSSSGGSSSSSSSAAAGAGGASVVGGASAGGRASGGSKSVAGGNSSGGASTGVTGGAPGAGGNTVGTGGSSGLPTGGVASTGGTSSKLPNSGGAGVGGSSSAVTGGTDAGGAPTVEPGVVYNGIQWADTSGNPIDAHGGGVIKVGAYYYWFGENRNPNNTFKAVSCYRSADLVNWEFRNNVLSQNSAAELKPANIERPKVIYNAKTKKYVMWMHWENGSDYTASRAAVASCDTVDGNYTYHGSARPLVGSGVTDHGIAGYQSRDCTAYVDTDGSGYFLSAANENYDLQLYLLSSDYLSIDSLAAVLFKGGHREAPALWKRNNVYFLVTSAATGWNPNQAQYATSSSLKSGWSSMTNVGDSMTFYSQSAFVLPVEGSSDTSFVYMGDRWAGAWGESVNNSSYIWMPISFPSSTTMSMAWNNTIAIDVGRGTVSGETNRFLFVNKATGKAFAVDGASSSNGAAIVQATPSSGKEQQFSLNYDAKGYFNLTNASSSLVVDVTSSATTDGASIIQYESNGGDNQKWRVVDKGSGNYQLLNKHSGKVAEASEGTTAVVQRTASPTANNQLWQLRVAK